MSKRKSMIEGTSYIIATSYHDIATMMFKAFGSHCTPGTTMLGIWKNEAEFKRWQISDVDQNSNAKIKIINSSDIGEVSLDFVLCVEGIEDFTIVKSSSV